MQKLFFPLYLVLLSIAARAGVIEPAAAIVKFPTTITKPGTYVVASNLVFKGTTGYAITVNADHVIIDLNEHTLTNEPAGSGTTTSAACIDVSNHDDFTLRNGGITGFYEGVLTNSGSDSGRTLIQNVNLTNCVYAGANLQGDIVEVRGCHTNDCGEYGINASANFATISDNIITNTNGGVTGGSSAAGIDVLAINSCTVSGNEVVNLPSNTGYVAIEINCYNGYSFAKENLASSYQYGIVFGYTTAGKYLNNLTENCATPFFGGTAVTGNN